MSYYTGKRDKEKTRITRYILRQAKKLLAIDIKGGRCIYCNEKRPWVLQFHHIGDKKEKIHNSLNSSWIRTKKEIKSCILVCENCHRTITGENNALERTIQNKTALLTIKGIKSCEQCGYTGCLKALDFHHTGKKFIDISNVVSNSRNFKITKELKKELKTCIILCANCHRDTHFNKNMYFKYEKYIKNKTIYLKDNYSKKVDRLKILELNKKGHTQLEISKKVKCGLSTVCEVLKTNGIHTFIKKRYINMQKVLELKTKGYINRNIAKIMGFNLWSLYRAIRKYRKEI